MKLRSKERKSLRRVAQSTVSVLAAACLVFGTVPAFAASGDPAVPTTPASPGNYVTGASPRPPAPGLEMLGITDVECDPANNTYMGKLDWGSPKFYIMGTYTYNSNPNPYYVNAVMNWDALGDGWENQDSSGQLVATPVPIVGGNTYVRTERSVGGNPDAGIPVYGTNDTADSLWDLQPDVVVGTDGDACEYNGETYQNAFAAGGISDYHPETVRYNYSTINQIIDSMYRIAIAADNVVEQSNGEKQLRYDESATEIAQNYEKYSHSLQGYILYRLASEGKDMKTIACVSNYDEASGTYTLLNNASGASNRFYEVAANVTNDLADELGSTTATLEQLQGVDVIILSSSLTGSGAADTVLDTFTKEMQEKTYYNTSGTGTGVLYDTSRNSIDTTAEMGRILGAIYNEYISQHDLVCYWYDEFYHVNSSELGNVIDNAMDGIRNWDTTNEDMTAWTAADAEGYVKEDIQKKLDLGTAYINSLDPDDVDEGIAFTVSSETGEQYLTSDATVSIGEADVALEFDSAAYTGGEIKPTVTVTFGGDILDPNTDYTVSYENNIDEGVATVTVTGTGLFKGTITSSFTISKATASDSEIAALKESITTAQNAMNGVEISSDGTDVSTDSTWVTEVIYNTLADAIASAEAVANTENVLQEAVEAAQTELETALESFLSAQKPGTMTGSTTPEPGTATAEEIDALNNAIANAQSALSGVVISTDGSDVDANTKWVTTDVYNTLTSAITAAQEAANTASVTSDAVKAAQDNLSAALSAFESAQKSGTKGANGGNGGNSGGSKIVKQTIKAKAKVTLKGAKKATVTVKNAKTKLAFKANKKTKKALKIKVKGKKKVIIKAGKKAKKGKTYKVKVYAKASGNYAKSNVLKLKVKVK